ncbi:unnamed protein product [Mytilus edulis]|uniref:Uncharacterized protein n=1 Tax=Mytilus edulis TaxID=6550 RepID=A0A8S3SAU3_MYTED|nr:unnamed protein product [Mytilus edulis]
MLATVVLVQVVPATADINSVYIFVDPGRRLESNAVVLVQVVPLLYVDINLFMFCRPRRRLESNACYSCTCTRSTLTTRRRLESNACYSCTCTSSTLTVCRLLILLMFCRPREDHQSLTLLQLYFCTRSTLLPRRRLEFNGRTVVLVQVVPLLTQEKIRVQCLQLYLYKKYLIRPRRRLDGHLHVLVQEANSCLLVQED